MFTVGKPDSVPLKGCIHLSRDASQKIAMHCALAGATNPKSLGEQPDFLFRLAPDWVYPAANIAVRAVSPYLAVSPLPACAGGLFSVTLAVRALMPVPRLREESCSAVSGLSSPFCGANASTVNNFSASKNRMVCNGYVRYSTGKCHNYTPKEWNRIYKLLSSRCCRCVSGVLCRGMSKIYTSATVLKCILQNFGKLSRPCFSIKLRSVVFTFPPAPFSNTMPASSLSFFNCRT